MTAREQFEDRWQNEQQTNPQPPENKEREYMIYLCGWEDGIRKYVSDINKRTYKKSVVFYSEKFKD